MEWAKVKLDDAGRLLIPARFRKAIEMRKDEWITLELDTDERELRIFTVREAIRRAQESVRKYVPENVSLVDELIAERRAEAARE
jgi:DNA-binding transcriptional regulator/RsmH inhibitor MraZ